MVSWPRFFMAIELTASQWHIVYKFVLVWLPIYVLTKHSVAWFYPSSLPVSLRVHHFLYPTCLFCPSDVLVWSLKHSRCGGLCCKEGNANTLHTGPSMRSGCSGLQAVNLSTDGYACCRSLFLWCMVLHQWCPMFRDGVVVLSSEVLYAGHFWHQNGSTIFVTVFLIQLYIIVAYWGMVSCVEDSLCPLCDVNWNHQTL